MAKKRVNGEGTIGKRKDGRWEARYIVGRDPETGKLCGDVDFAAIEPKASVITPVPGGVGPMTICCLMENTIECFLRRAGR